VKAGDERESATRFRQFVGPHRAPLALGVALAVVQAAALVPVPLLVASVFDDALPSGDRGALVRGALGVVACSVINAVCAVAAQQ
jgi:hypothetical protein